MTTPYKIMREWMKPPLYLIFLHGYIFLGGSLFYLIETRFKLQRLKMTLQDMDERLEVLVAGVRAVYMQYFSKEPPHYENRKYIDGLIRPLVMEYSAASSNFWKQSEKGTFAGSLWYAFGLVTGAGASFDDAETIFGRLLTVFYSLLGIPFMVITVYKTGEIIAHIIIFCYNRKSNCQKNVKKSIVRSPHRNNIAADVSTTQERHTVLPDTLAMDHSFATTGTPLQGDGSVMRAKPPRPRPFSLYYKTKTLTDAESPYEVEIFRTPPLQPIPLLFVAIPLLAWWITLVTLMTYQAKDLNAYQAIYTLVSLSTGTSIVPASQFQYDPFLIYLFPLYIWNYVCIATAGHLALAARRQAAVDILELANLPVIGSPPVCDHRRQASPVGNRVDVTSSMIEDHKQDEETMPSIFV